MSECCKPCCTIRLVIQQVNKNRKKWSLGARFCSFIELICAGSWLPERLHELPLHAAWVEHLGQSRQLRLPAWSQRRLQAVASAPAGKTGLGPLACHGANWYHCRSARLSTAADHTHHQSRQVAARAAAYTGNQQTFYAMQYRVSCSCSQILFCLRPSFHQIAHKSETGFRQVTGFSPFTACRRSDLQPDRSKRIWNL